MTVTTQIVEAFARIREERPLLHHITNLVVMNDTANVTLHVGALPVMAHAVDEVTEMTAMAGALVLNIGTLAPAWIESMVVAGRTANEVGIPIVLDPVGAGATQLRTETAWRFLEELDVAIVRGNAGELGVLAGAGGDVKGVESVGGPTDRVEVVRELARQWKTVAAMTGERDVISDGERTLSVHNGHNWLTTLTGTGCMATTVVAAFAAVEADPLLAAAGGLATYGLAAELAAPQAAGPASFKVAFFDQLYNLTPEQVKTGVQVTDLNPINPS